MEVTDVGRHGLPSRRCDESLTPEPSRSEELRQPFRDDLAVSLAVLVVTVAQVLDLGTFVHMVARRGPGSEANPLVAHLLAGEGLPFVIITKLAALALTVAVIAVLAGRDGLGHRRLAGAVAVVAILAGLVGGMTNAGTILAGAV